MKKNGLTSGRTVQVLKYFNHFLGGFYRWAPAVVWACDFCGTEYAVAYIDLETGEPILPKCSCDESKEQKTAGTP